MEWADVEHKCVAGRMVPTVLLFQRTDEWNPASSPHYRHSKSHDMREVRYKYVKALGQVQASRSSRIVPYDFTPWPAPSVPAPQPVGPPLDQGSEEHMRAGDSTGRATAGDGSAPWQAESKPFEFGISSDVEMQGQPYSPSTSHAGGGMGGGPTYGPSASHAGGGVGGGPPCGPSASHASVGMGGGPPCGPSTSHASVGMGSGPPIGQRFASEG